MLRTVSYLGAVTLVSKLAEKRPPPAVTTCAVPLPDDPGSTASGSWVGRGPEAFVDDKETTVEGSWTVDESTGAPCVSGGAASVVACGSDALPAKFPPGIVGTSPPIAAVALGNGASVGFIVVVSKDSPDKIMRDNR